MNLFKLSNEPIWKDRIEPYYSKMLLMSAVNDSVFKDVNGQDNVS